MTDICNAISLYLGTGTENHTCDDWNYNLLLIYLRMLCDCFCITDSHPMYKTHILYVIHDICKCFWMGHRPEWRGSLPIIWRCTNALRAFYLTEWLRLYIIEYLYCLQFMLRLHNRNDVINLQRFMFSYVFYVKLWNVPK